MSSQPRSSAYLHRFVSAESQPARGTLLLLHGTGGNEEDLLPLGQGISAGDWNLLSPRGQVLENGMPRFFRRLAEGVFDEADLVRRANELADFVCTAAQQYQFDPARVFAFGYSNGANMAAAILLLRPSSLAGAVLLRAMLPIVPESLPNLTDVSVLLSAGRLDSLIPIEGTRRLAALLRECGAEVEEHWQPGSHQLTQNDILAAREWLRRFGYSNP
jgi:predicted esterase